MIQEFPVFPSDFIFGAATASYQIEGAWDRDGKGLSIWDEFTSRIGKVQNNDNGRVACDHYHRYMEDVALMKEMGLQAYRFSISWPRILPDGTGGANERGLDFYERLVDALLDAGIRPFVTLYHWDLPLALQKSGGWTNRDAAGWFADYTAIVVERLGDRVKNWITLNEPFIFSAAGNITGDHAPGYKNPVKYFKTIHNALRGHGMAMSAIKSHDSVHEAGITLDLRPLYPRTNSEKDKRAVHYADLAMRRMFLDPLFKGHYPEEYRKKNRLWFPRIHEGDMETIAVPMDFLGINNYSRDHIRYVWWLPGNHFWSSTGDIPEGESEREGVQYTAMGWEVYPSSLYEVLQFLKREYDNPVTYITENGGAFDDVKIDGVVNDRKRIDLLASYLAELKRAIDEGARCKGYFVWSLLDNFEWAEGYSKRFGIIHVDYDSLERTVKDSGKWYKKMIAYHKER